jgi:choline dehydrogenase
VSILRNPAFHPVSELLLQAAAQSSVGRSEDYNSSVPSGLGVSQLYLRRGIRCGAARAYLQPAEKRANLQVISRAAAQRVLFEGRRAVGIEYRRDDGSITTVRAREVILSAGAIGTPQLLELSGVGDAARLGALGVPVVHNLPAVGEYLQDHFLVFIAQRLGGIRGLSAEFSGWRAARNGLQYLLFRNGYLGGTATQASGHATVKVGGRDVMVQFTGVPLSFSVLGEQKKVIVDKPPAIMLGMNVCVPESRGHVHARSRDMAQAPEIVGNFLAQAADRDATVAGLKLVRNILGQQALAAVRREELFPGPAVATDEQLLQFARVAGMSADHSVGSCRMGTSPQDSVISSASLRMHGIDGLRIVDASIMPRLVSANTHGPTVALAEKAAEIITRDIG